MILNIRIWRNNRERVIHRHRVIVPFKSSRAHIGIFVRVEKFRRSSRQPVPPPRLTRKAGRTRWFGTQAARSNQADWTHRRIAPLGDDLQISSYAFSRLIDSRRAFSASDRHVPALRELRRFALSPVTSGLFVARGPRQGLWRGKQTRRRDGVCRALLR